MVFGAAPPAPRSLRTGEAHALGWLVVALSNAVAIALLPYPGALSIRLTHHVFDFGQVLALALVSLGVGSVWPRFGARARKLAPFVLALFALALSAATLVPDFTNFAERLDHPWLAYAGAAMTSQAVPAAFVAGGRLASPRGRIAAGIIAFAMVFVHHVVLVRAYPGIHLYWVWTAVTLFGRAFSGAALPNRLASLTLRPSVIRAALGLAALGAVASLVVWPRYAVVSQIFQTNGSVLFPFLAKARETRADEAVDAEVVASGLIAERWLAENRHERPVRPSKPRLAPKSPIVILLTFDAVGIDAANELRRAGRWPNVEALARESVEFTQARSPAAGTRQTMGAIFTGRYASQVQWVDRKISSRTLRLTEPLARLGLRTIHLEVFDEIGSGALGRFDREIRVRPGRKEQRRALSEDVLPRALEELDAAKGEPAFLFMHWLDPHAPYDSQGTEGSKRDAYLREVEACDTRFGELRRALEQRGLWERVILILASDHGEAFGDHGIATHGNGLYESLLRVPLFIRVPGVAPRKSDVPVSLIDLGPTLLDLLGARTPGRFVGQSLVPVLRGQAPSFDRPIAGDGGTDQTMLFGRHKLIEDRSKQSVELYDLSTDPRERRNLFGTLGGKDELMLKVMRYYFAAHLPEAASEDGPRDEPRKRKKRKRRP
ncbi:MAG TPA: sulfatase [Polyangiaceae bacterium]